MNERRTSGMHQVVEYNLKSHEIHDHANVKFPPPLIHGVGILAGIGFGKWVQPLPLGLSWSLWPGWGLLIAALMIAGWAFREFGRSQNPLPPNQPINVLMFRGPYRFTRNPLYLALALLHTGLGLLSGNAWVLLTVLPTLLIVRYYVIEREEAYLIRRFGRIYLDYQASVRRWL